MKLRQKIAQKDVNIEIDLISSLDAKLPETSTVPKQSSKLKSHESKPDSETKLSNPHGMVDDPGLKEILRLMFIPMKNWKICCM